MNDRVRESLSAVMDNEANELELERVLSQVGENQELRDSWSRYQIARGAITGQAQSLTGLDISASVREAIAAEAPAETQGTGESFRDRFLRPLASLAVAASVTATVVIGGQQLSQIGASEQGAASPTVAASPSPVSFLNSLGATTVTASYGTESRPVLSPASHKAYEELARQRMGKYMQEHAEHAALNSPQGLIPFSRVPEIKE